MSPSVNRIPPSLQTLRISANKKIILHFLLNHPGFLAPLAWEAAVTVSEAQRETSHHDQDPEPLLQHSKNSWNYV